MGLDALLARLEADPVTSATSTDSSDVTPKPAPALAYTPVTSETSPTGVTAQTHARWLLHFGGRDPVPAIFAPAVDHAGALAAYPAAIAAEPMAEPTTAPTPADLLALFNACEAAGLYDAADRAALPAMLATDAEGTRQLIEATHSRIGDCRNCHHFCRPGQSAGYCTERPELPQAYGLLREPPKDGGAQCEHFARVLT